MRIKCVAALIAAITLSGCAGYQLGNEYIYKREPVAIIATPNGQVHKHWRIFQHPTDQNRILVTESRGVSFAKSLDPLSILFDDNAAGAQFDDALTQYLSANRPGCEIARSNEVRDLYAYEYHLRCEATAIR